MTCHLELAHADDTYVPRIVPQCTMYKTKLDLSVCGYSNVEDWKLVLTADSELFLAREELKKKEAVVTNLTLQISNLEGQTAAYLRSFDALKERNAALTKQLIELDEKYQQERVKPQFGNPLAWGIAGVSLSVLAGVLLAQTL